MILYQGDFKYFAEVHHSMSSCQLELTKATDEFKAIKAKIIRAECIAIGVEL